MNGSSPSTPARPTARSAAPSDPAMHRPGDVLADLDPITTPADHDVIAAVIMFLRGASGDPELRLVWARYAYHAAERLAGVDHPLWMQTAQLYRRVLAEQQLTFDAALICERRLTVYRRRGNPARVVLSQCAFGAALHEDGQCARAEHEVGEALTGWAAGLRDASPGQIVVLSVAGVRAGCGAVGPAVEVLHEYAAVLAGLDDTGRREAAAVLAHTVQTHPARCEQPAQVSRRARREAFWLRQLTPKPAGPGWRTR